MEKEKKIKYIRVAEPEYRRLKRKDALTKKMKMMIREHWRMVASVKD